MTAPSASSGIARADLKVLVACISGTLVSVGGQSFIALTVGVLGGGYGLSPGKAGLFVTLHLVAMAVAAVCMGRWPPGRAAPRVAVGGASVLGLAYLGLAFLRGEIPVASALIIAGAGAGVAATLTTRAVLGAALAGWADRRFGLVLPLLGCVIGMAACYVGLALAGDVIMYAIVMGWFGLFLGAFSPYMMGFVAELGNDPRLPAGVTSVSIFATAAGPALGGHLAERFGYLPLSLVAAGLAAVACVAFLAVRPGRTQAVIA